MTLMKSEQAGRWIDVDRKHWPALLALMAHRRLEAGVCGETAVVETKDLTTDVKRGIICFVRGSQSDLAIQALFRRQFAVSSYSAADFGGEAVAVTIMGGKGGQQRPCLLQGLDGQQKQDGQQPQETPQQGGQQTQEEQQDEQQTKEQPKQQDTRNFRRRAA